MNSRIHLPRQALAVAASLALAPCAFSQQAPETLAAATLDKVIVTGNPLRSSEVAAPVSVLSGDELVIRRGATLGETLASQPGVSSTYFGPNANRPTIRGLDGERVRMLSNAGGSMDASTLSYDHAVPIDPLLVERIEVLRGPAALFFGGSALGGVVNAIDNRIPRDPITRTGGAVELRVGGAERERAGAAMVETGNGRFALHVDAFGRNTSDLKVPAFTPLEDGAPLPESNRVRNSASRTRGAAVGGAIFFDKGSFGLSVDGYDSRYGTPAEPDVGIDMKRDHVGASLELKDLSGALRGVRAHLNHTDYEHKEVEADGAVGTIFTSRGHELRVEAEHAKLGPMRGSVGVQLEEIDFGALGEEAFVPSTRTKRQGVFALEELAWTGGTLTGGLRVERAKVSSEGDADPSDPRFGPPAARSFSLRSASVSNLVRLGGDWSTSVALSRSERAPTSFELFANGVHVATGAYERGDANLAKERGTNLELALQWQSGKDHLRLGAFATRFKDFISLESTGATVPVVDEDGNTVNVPEVAFRAVNARMNGLEVEGRKRLLDASYVVDLGGKLDVTRARNASTGEPLPRVAPLRMLVGLDISRGPWNARAEIDHAQRQDRVPATDTPTDGYTIANLSFTRRFTLGETEALWFVKLNNIGDTLAYSASTFQTVRGLSPLPGRSLKTGVRVVW